MADSEEEHEDELHTSKHLANFLFGNIDNDGELDEDFFDNETKRSLASLCQMGLGSQMLELMPSKEDDAEEGEKNGESDEKEPNSDNDCEMKEAVMEQDENNYSIKSPSALDFFDEVEVADESPQQPAEAEKAPQSPDRLQTEDGSLERGASPSAPPEEHTAIATVTLHDVTSSSGGLVPKELPDLIVSDPLTDPLALPEMKDEVASSANDVAGYEADDEGAKADTELMPPPPTPGLTDAQTEEELRSRRLETPLAAMLPSKYADISVTRLFPDFRVDKVLRFSRLFGPGKPSSLPQIWRNVRKRKKKRKHRPHHDQSDSGSDSERAKENKKGWDFNYGPDPTPDMCGSDDEDKLLRPVEDESSSKNQDQGENPDMGPRVADWRFGPAQVWYDTLDVPETGDGFNYGFKLKEENEENKKRESKEDFPDDAFLMVAQLRWEDDVVWNGDDIKQKDLECDVCGETFESDTLLYDHARFSHLDENIVCDECGKHFRSEKSLYCHQQNAHNLDPESSIRHKCPDCGKGYRDRQGLREHMATHMSLKPYPCDKCDRAYNRYSRLKQHQLTHVYVDSMECFECDSCGLAFPTEELALQHSQLEDHVIQTVTLTKVYRCEFCDIVFSRADSLNQHRPVHDGVERPYVCHICSAAFSSYSRVTTHKSTHGVYDRIEPQENEFSIPKHFLCEHCGLSYLYWSYLRTHRKTRHSDNPYVVTCKLCPEKFKNTWSAVYHRKKVHEGGGTVRDWRRKGLSCSICGVNYMYQHTLDMHMEKKHGPYTDGQRENYQCEACGKVFKYQSSLVLHQKMHEGQKSFHCEECNKGFLTVATWRNHVKRCHEGVRPHKCDFCDKTFFHKVARDDHVRVHTGEKPFECQYCQKTFRLKSMLTDHVKIHSDDRPYPCDLCGMSFRRMVHMKQHRMIHTGERPYECPMCHLDFRLKQELQRHLKSKHTAPELPKEEEFLLGE